MWPFNPKTYPRIEYGGRASQIVLFEPPRCRVSIEVMTNKTVVIYRDQTIGLNPNCRDLVEEAIELVRRDFESGGWTVEVEPD